MPNRTLTLALLAILIFFFTAAGLAAAQQQAGLGDIGNATVTLYYYDDVNKTKGAIVPLGDNPQHVNYDPALAAPGMYTFSHVPSGQWYYLEADHCGNKWYSIFYMGEGTGTKTANVHIPPWTPANATANIPATPSPSATVTAMPTTSAMPPTVFPGPEGPRATPGMTLPATAAAATLAIALARKTR